MAKRIASLYAEIGADASGLKRGLREAKTELGKVDKTFQKFMAGGVAAFAGITGAVAVAKKAIEFAKEGAQLELLEQRFVNLSASIGTTSDALINELGAATGGMMSNAEMISSASQIISLGLGSTKEEVVDLASLVSNLGWDMQQVIMTFANNSKARLDALGLSVTDVEDRMKLLEAQGYDTDKAFDLAVIEAGKAKLKLLGSAADTSAGAIARVETAFKDAGDAAKKGFAKGLEAAIAAADDAAGGMGEVTTKIELYTERIVTSTLKLIMWGEELDRLAFGGVYLLEKRTGELGDAQRETAKVMDDELTPATQRAMDEFVNFGGAARTTDKHTRTLIPLLDEVAIGMRDVRTGAEEAVWATRQFGEEATGAGTAASLANENDLIPLENTLKRINGSWQINVDINVSGIAALQEAKTLLLNFLNEGGDMTGAAYPPGYDPDKIPGTGGMDPARMGEGGIWDGGQHGYGRWGEGGWQGFGGSGAHTSGDPTGPSPNININVNSPVQASPAYIGQVVADQIVR